MIAPNPGSRIFQGASKIGDPGYTGRMKPSFIFAVAAGFACLTSQGIAQDGAADPVAMSPEDWQAQVKASRPRAEAMRREHRSFAVQPTMEEIAERNSRTILEDDSLLPGDVISTNRGLFQFRGSPDGNRRPEDFVRIR